MLGLENVTISLTLLCWQRTKKRRPLVYKLITDAKSDSDSLKLCTLLQIKKIAVYSVIS